MRGLVYAAAAGALLFAANANAQAIDATGQGSGQIRQDELTIPTPAGRTQFNMNGEGGSVEALVSVTSTQASFESGVAVSGGWSEATSYSGLDVTLFNNTDGLVSIENFGSTIIPAGMGFYLQDRIGDATDSNIFTGYGQTASGLTFDDLSPTAYYEPLAFSDFEFEITMGETVLYSLSGSLSLYWSEGGVIPVYNLEEAANRLDDFVTAYDTDYALAYAWGETHIEVPLGISLETGDSRTIEYRTRVTSRTRAECITATTCLVAYSGFGDPIGRGGGVSLMAARGDFGAMDAGLNPITGIVFSPQTFTPFQPLDSGVVPEPATWLSMILGFGLLGAALRRRRVLSYS